MGEHEEGDNGPESAGFKIFYEICLSVFLLLFF